MADYMRNHGTPSAQLRGEFFVDSERDGLASARAGRDIYRSVERVRIVIPGAVASIVVKNVDDSHRERWPEAYAAFKRGQEAPLEGLPLEEWPVLNRAQIAELRYLQIRTVEELATLSDVAVQRIGMGGMGLRRSAKGFLDDAERESHNTKLRAENERLQGRVATLEQQVAALDQHVLQLAQANQHYRDTAPAMQSLVPGTLDPFELAKLAPGREQGANAAEAMGAGGSPGATAGGAGSSLDALAAMARRPRRGAAGLPPLPGAEAGDGAADAAA